MSIAQLNGLWASATAARQAADYDSAIGYATDMLLLLAATPNLSRDLSGGVTQSLTFPGAAAVGLFIEQCRKLKAAGHAATYGIQQTAVEYQRTESTDGY